MSQFQCGGPSSQNPYPSKTRWAVTPAIYAVLIQSVAISGDAINAIWSIVGYTVLLCFSLFKTSSVTKSVLGAH